MAARCAISVLLGLLVKCHFMYYHHYYPAHCYQLSWPKYKALNTQREFSTFLIYLFTGHIWRRRYDQQINTNYSKQEKKKQNECPGNPTGTEEEIQWKLKSEGRLLPNGRRFFSTEWFYVKWLYRISLIIVWRYASWNSE